MDKKYNTMEYNNAIACEVCGRLNFADDYGNSENVRIAVGNNVAVTKWKKSGTA